MQLDASLEASYISFINNGRMKQMALNQNQADLVEALRTVSNELADYVYDKFADEGKSFDEVHSELRQAVKLVDGWRIGRGV